jgi:hypothetical protein
MKSARAFPPTVLAIAVALAGLAGCDFRHGDSPPAVSADPSAQVIGTVPAPPTGDSPGTTAVDAGAGGVSKTAQSEKMPQEGDNHSHSTLSETAPLKAAGADPAAQDRSSR